MSEQFPQYYENGEEILFFPNLWRETRPQQIVGADCFLPVANINNGLNRFVLDITGVDFRKMLSSLLLGAEITYPDEFMQIITNFLKMVHCPVDFEEECQEYPTYTPIIQYSPMNPFNNPDEVPEGYLAPPFVFVNEDNIEDYGDYQVGDILVPLDSVTLDLDWFETLDGQLPTITIQVQGSGKLALNLLVVPFGGVAVITVDNPPNLADIIVGIVTGADNIVDLNRDIVAIPPETAEHIVYPVDVVGAGMHTVYCVFLPILDDSLIPIRFGGGLRSIELCDFGEFPMGYVEDVRWDWDSTMLQKRINGEWINIEGWDNDPDGESFMQYWIYPIEDTANTALINSVNALEQIAGLNETNVEYIYPSLEALNESQESQDADIAALQANALSQGESIENLSTDLEALEDEVTALASAMTAQQVWRQEFDFTEEEGNWGSGAPWAAGLGYLISPAQQNINYSSLNIMDSRVTFIEIEFQRSTGTGNLDVDFQYPAGENAQTLNVPTDTDVHIQWMQINRMDDYYVPYMRFVCSGAHSFYIRKAIFWGRGSNPF